MNFRQKSKLKGKWAFIRYPSNLAIYAVCQNCGYSYPSYDMKENMLGTQPSLEKLHRYCPNCGLKMKPFNGTFVYIYSDLVNEDECK